MVVAEELNHQILAEFPCPCTNNLPLSVFDTLYMVPSQQEGTGGVVVDETEKAIAASKTHVETLQVSM